MSEITSRQGAANSVSSPTNLRRSSDPQSLSWLVRYARHCGRLANDAGAPAETQLRALFGAAAWRVLCRSERSAFLPILRNRELDLDSLIQYCKDLALRSFVRAPRPDLLAYFVSQRRLYYTQRCRPPRDIDFVLMRIASKEPSVRRADIARVYYGLDREQVSITARARWTTLVRRARQAAELELTKLQHAAHRPWHFYCREIPWRGLQITPLVDPVALWQEGAAMASCLYKLRPLCESAERSRFFSVCRGGKRLATLELYLTAPRRGDVGMDRELGRWIVRDLRLAHNAVPDAVLSASMKDFATLYNQWAKRPGRWMPGHRGEIPQAVSPPPKPASRPTPQPSRGTQGQRRMTLSREEMEAAARAVGMRIAGPDHPVYSEGPTIVFVSGGSRKTGAKVFDLPALGADQLGIHQPKGLA